MKIKTATPKSYDGVMVDLRKHEDEFGFVQFCNNGNHLKEFINKAIKNGNNKRRKKGRK